MSMNTLLHYVVVLAVIAFAAVELALGHLDSATAVGIVATAGGVSIGVGSQSPNVGSNNTTPKQGV